MRTLLENMESVNYVIILANGKSSRFGSDKLSALLLSQKGEISVLEKTLSVFDSHPEISGIFVVRDAKNNTNTLEKYSKFSGYISGGKTRYESFCAGISEISHCLEDSKNSKNIKILVHNGANPFVSHSEISDVLMNIESNVAVGVGRKMTNTLRKWDTDTSEIIPRETVYAMETPQGAFLYDFKNWISFQKKKESDIQNSENSEISEITDELMLAEKNSGSIKICPASPQNIKITYMSDLPEKTQKFPITGFGVDSHRLGELISLSSDAPEKSCKLCGVVIENFPKFSGNSDADIAIHALCNAILSGLGKNSFSEYADEMCQNGEKNSEKYLQKILEIMNNTGADEDKNVKILHVVLSFEGKRPKVEKYFPLFRANIARLLQISETQIGLNATTGEGLDGCGRGEGMKVSAVVTMLL